MDGLGKRSKRRARAGKAVRGNAPAVVAGKNAPAVVVGGSAAAGIAGGNAAVSGARRGRGSVASVSPVALAAAGVAAAKPVSPAEELVASFAGAPEVVAATDNRPGVNNPPADSRPKEKMSAQELLEVKTPEDDDATSLDQERATDLEDQPTTPWRWLHRALKLAAFLIVIAGVAYGSFFLAYKDKIYPGVSVDGINLGGMSREAAATKIAERTEAFQGNVIAIRHSGGGTTQNKVTRVPVKDLALSYDIQTSVKRAFDFGRRGEWQQQLGEQSKLLTQAFDYSVYYYDDTKLTPYLLDISEDASSPVENAKLVFTSGKVVVQPATAGARLDIGALTRLVEERLMNADGADIAEPVYQLAPVVSTADLEAAADRASTYISAPVSLNFGTEYKEISRETIVGWLKVNHKSSARFLDSLKVDDIYAADAITAFALDRSAFVAYVAELAKDRDKTAINAALAMADGKLTVTAPSVNGSKLDQAGAVDAIMAALAKPAATTRVAALKTETTRAAVREDNLDSLGIKEQISEGVTYFPGSTSARLTNVRVGAARFNGVVLAPGETFSFGALLGAVDASTGYEPELVILENHEEKQYGGGLCQVSSTAFRAALLAGLPIIERHNHAFAISYYTAPYGVPGVDATIYYPQVDMKFTNDTGHYILIQTIFEGTTLKFDYYGTKTKTGSIRGPFYVSGNSDSTKPSHTVFYRDVLDLTGAVTKTDTFDTYYQSSKDFPIEKQYN